MERPIAPAHILHEIRGLDSHFDVRWNRVRQNWEVFYKSNCRAPFYVMRVQNDDHSYRPLDRRTVNHLRWILWANRNPVRFLYEQCMEDFDTAERKEAQYERDVYDQALEQHSAFDGFARAHGFAHTAKRRPVVTPNISIGA
jgi:hypothetical protein